LEHPGPVRRFRRLRRGGSIPAAAHPVHPTQFTP